MSVSLILWCGVSPQIIVIFDEEQIQDSTRLLRQDFNDSRCGPQRSEWTFLFASRMNLGRKPLALHSSQLTFDTTLCRNLVLCKCCQKVGGLLCEGKQETTPPQLDPVASSRSATHRVALCLLLATNTDRSPWCTPFSCGTVCASGDL